MMLIADLFCGAGGAAMGIHRACEKAGIPHRIVGFDIKKQPRYPFEFVQQDALTVDLRFCDAVWASPPCQYYTRLRHLPWLKDRVYWRSIPPTRALLTPTGKPYVIENVQDAVWDMETPAILCGYSLGLSILRHRCFETWPFAILQPGHKKHDRVIVSGGVSPSQRHHGGQGFKGINCSSIAGHGNFKGDTQRWRENTGIAWMTGHELAQAVPPVYAEYIWSQLITACRRELIAGTVCQGIVTGVNKGRSDS